LYTPKTRINVKYYHLRQSLVIKQ